MNYENKINMFSFISIGARANSIKYALFYIDFEIIQNYLIIEDKLNKFVLYQSSWKFKVNGYMF